MTLRFTKMHGIGNDFVVIDAIRQQVDLCPGQVRFLADRRYGVGCDQVLLAEPATEAGADFRYRIFNADGSEVEQCGNGVRCLAVFLADQGYTSERELVIQTLGGPTRVILQPDGRVAVDMGAPRLEPSTIPFLAERQQTTYPLDVDGERLTIAALSMGNPHAVIQVAEVESAPVARLGPLIENHTAFPRRANAGFMQVVDRSRIRLRVHERGAGETLACGTGACAAVVAGRMQGLLADEVRVSLPGGELLIHWNGNGGSVWMTGPATTVFSGEVELPGDAPGKAR